MVHLLSAGESWNKRLDFEVGLFTPYFQHPANMEDKCKSKSFDFIFSWFVVVFSEGFYTQIHSRVLPADLLLESRCDGTLKVSWLK